MFSMLSQTCCAMFYHRILCVECLFLGSNSDTFHRSEYSSRDTKSGFTTIVLEYCVLIACWIALPLHNNLRPPATLSQKNKIAGKTKGHLMHRCLH